MGIQELDKALEYFYNNQAKMIRAFQISEFVFLNQENQNINKSQILIDRLQKDEYVTFEVRGTLSSGYVSSFDGIIFYELGGYKNQVDQIASNERRVSLLETRQAQTERRLYLINLVIAIATGGLLLLEITKWIVGRLDLVWCK